MIQIQKQIPIKHEQASLLIKEGYIASTSIGYGLNALRKAGIHMQGEYYQAFFQLSIGLERLMKLIIIQHYRSINNNFPNNKTMKEYGHNLVELYKKIYEFEANNNPKEDDILSVKTLEFLSEFAMSTRYYNLDSLTGRHQTINPLVEWSEIQNEIYKRHFEHKKDPKSEMKEMFYNIMNENSYVIAYDEKNKLFKSPKELFEKTEKNKRVQGHSVYYLYLIIQRLVEILENIEYEYNLYPCLREFFVLFNCDLSKKEILNKKRWLYP